jgi:toxin CcdB
MARLDVHRQPDGTLVLDCQADILSGLNTRLVVPLLPPEDAPGVAADRLNPTFEIGSDTVVMFTQFASAIPVRELGAPVASLAEEHSTIMNALDMLLTGY